MPAYLPHVPQHLEGYDTISNEWVRGEVISIEFTDHMEQVPGTDLEMYSGPITWTATLRTERGIGIFSRFRGTMTWQGVRIEFHEPGPHSDTVSWQATGHGWSAQNLNQPSSQGTPYEEEIDITELFRELQAGLGQDGANQLEPRRTNSEGGFAQNTEGGFSDN